MENKTFSVSVPATTANLGPGFDCLALALDLWNETTFTLGGNGLRINVKGEGNGEIVENEQNLIIQSILYFFRTQGVQPPSNLQIDCENQIPICSGLGSSAAAILTGLLAANTLLNNQVGVKDILKMVYQLEGHPDNAAAALLGGIVVVISHEEDLLTLKFDLPTINLVIVIPQIRISTQKSRAVLPKKVLFEDAVFNIGRSAIVLEALRTGNMPLLGKAMEDRLHQPYRLELIPGAKEALNAAKHDAGAVATALSGAGPGLIAFTTKDSTVVAEAMVAAFNQANVIARSFSIHTTNRGTSVYL